MDAHNALSWLKLKAGQPAVQSTQSEAATSIERRNSGQRCNRRKSV